MHKTCRSPCLQSTEHRTEERTNTASLRGQQQVETYDSCCKYLIQKVSKYTAYFLNAYGIASKFNHCILLPVTLVLKWVCIRSRVCISRKPVSVFECIAALLMRRLRPLFSKICVVCSNADWISLSFVTSIWMILRFLFFSASACSSSALTGSRQVAKRNWGWEGWERICLTNSRPRPRLAPVMKTDRGPIVVLQLKLHEATTEDRPLAFANMRQRLKLLPLQTATFSLCQYAAKAKGRCLQGK